MDSRQLYNAAAHLTSLIKWDKDWIHFGTGEQIKIELISGLTRDFLADDHINFVHAREDSGTRTGLGIVGEIENVLGLDDFQLWNQAMDRVIKFNKIGVLQLGRR